MFVFSRQRRAPRRVAHLVAAQAIIQIMRDLLASDGSSLVARYERARARYRPERIRILFVAEAPPADLRRFFYFEDVEEHDWLFLGLIRWLYQEADEAEIDEMRSRKREYLEKFREDGYYLVDARDVPMPRGAKAAMKRQLLRDSLDQLEMNLRALVRDETRIVLISGRMYDVCYARLKGSGLNVINEEMIDFPSSGRQKRRKLGQLLDDDLRDAIRALEESVRFWGPGRENQKKREAYVAAHFLRTLGVKFAASELIQPDEDPPDVVFREAAFEIKEVQERGRRRGDEYKRRLARARQVEHYRDLLEHFTPTDVSIGKVLDRLIAEAQDLAARKYPSVATRRRLDLLFYVNLSRVWGIQDGPRPDVEPLRGWRSVSFLRGAATCCVICARPDAPEFLRARQGALVVGHDVG